MLHDIKNDSRQLLAVSYKDLKFWKALVLDWYLVSARNLSLGIGIGG